MSKIVVLAFVIFLTAVVSSLPTNEELRSLVPEHCKYKGVFITKGKTVPAPIGECITVTCVSNGTYTTQSPCIMFTAAPGCRVGPRDLTKQYPDCCSRHICSDEDEE